MLTVEEVVAQAADGELSLAEWDIRQRLSRAEGDPLLASKGAGSVHALFRDGECIGYAVWSCRLQGWVAGSWDRPIGDYRTAERHLRRMPWEG